jgi:predicted nucleic acid-binding Zn ribbon protein
MQSARPILKKIVTAALRQASPEEAPLLAWPLACGSTVGEKTAAAAFADGVLTVEVPDETWRRQLQQLCPQYLSALNQFSPQPVSAIRFVLKPRTAVQ